MRRIDFSPGSSPACELTAGGVFSDISSSPLAACPRARARADKVDCFQLHYGNFDKSFRYVSIFLAEVRGTARAGRVVGGEGVEVSWGWRADATYPGPCTLTPRRYEILHLVVIQSWTHLALYGAEERRVEIFARRITKFRGASPASSRSSTRPRQRRGTRSSWRQSGYWVSPTAGATFKILFPYISSRALLLFSALFSPRPAPGGSCRAADPFHSGIFHQAPPPRATRLVMSPARLWRRGAFCSVQ